MTFPFPHTNAGLKYEEPGSIEFTTPGTFSFVVPRYKNMLVVEVWGAGAGGASGYQASSRAGGNGEASTFAGLSAGGGTGGYRTPTWFPPTGGIATGGDINTNGKGGNNYAGWEAPNGGTGGTAGAGGTGISHGGNGGAPGGGGGGAWLGNIEAARNSGGGSGAYVKKTYAKGALIPKSIETTVVGAGGKGYVFTANYTGGDGGNGKIKISWT